MKKTYVPVTAAWIATFVLLGINFLIRRDVFPHWMTAYVFQLLVPVGLLLIIGVQTMVFCRSVYFLLEKPNKKEAFVKMALSLIWIMGGMIPGISLQFPDISNSGSAPSPPAVPAERAAIPLNPS